MILSGESLSFYDFLERLPICLGGVPKPDNDAICEHALYKSSVGLG